MGEDFKWTDELAYEYRHSFDKSGNYLSIEDFKQSKQNSNKDWEIVEFNHKYSTYSLWHDKKYHRMYMMDSDTTLSHVPASAEIKSVRRISDNEVFSVGENILYGAGENTETIKLFREDKYGLSVITNSVTLSFEHLKKAKQKLFTTEDGKDIYEGDEVVSVGKKSFQIGHLSSMMTSSLQMGHFDSYKYFSTEDAAEDYVAMNKDLFSVNEIISKLNGYFKYHLEARQTLKYLAKEKINNGERQ